MFLKKKYGQNLLKDTSFIQKMIAVSNISSDCYILEIGPGTGYLTKELLPIVNKVAAVEIDTDFSSILNKLSNSYPDKLSVVYGDIKKCDLNDITGGQTKWICFANIPYYITSPIIELLIENRHLFTAFYLTIQKEVAERICAAEGSKHISAFTFYTQYYADCKLNFIIPAIAFEPSPKVDSAFISMKIRENSPVGLPFDKIRPIIAKAFEMRRKTVRNSLKSMTGNKDISAILSDAGVDPDARPQELKIEDFAEIAKILGKTHE